VAVINVGASTETEMKEKKARVEDALNATRAAVEEGIVPGGGVALLRCVAALDELKLEGDQQVGVSIVRRALEERGRATEEYGDMIEAGIIDPTKVTRTALQNAASIAGLMARGTDLKSVPQRDRRQARGRQEGRRHARRDGRHGRHGRRGYVLRPANGRGRAGRPSPAAVAAGQHGRPIT